LVPQKTQYPEFKIHDRVLLLEARMSTESFQLMRWVKLARQKGIPYFDPPVSLEPALIAFIRYMKQPMRELTPVINPSDIEKKRFGKYWDDSFHWDLVSKRVAEVKMPVEDRYAPSRKKFQI
jgi:hypothetical protein